MAQQNVSVIITTLKCLQPDMHIKDFSGKHGEEYFGLAWCTDVMRHVFEMPCHWHASQPWLLKARCEKLLGDHPTQDSVPSPSALYRFIRERMCCRARDFCLRRSGRWDACLSQVGQKTCFTTIMQLVCCIASMRCKRFKFSKAMSDPSFQFMHLGL